MTQQDIEEAAHRLPVLDPSRRAQRGSLVEEGLKSANTEEAPLSQARRPEEPPRSTRAGLPLTHITKPPEPRLLHPFLLKLPLHVRFGCNGLIANILFMVAYNSAVSMCSAVSASTLYSIIYLVFIPLGHAMTSLLVFGWPERYIPSLMSNFPIGLTAIAIGGLLTAYLDKIEFNERIEEFIRDNFTFSTMPARTKEDKKSEFYASLLVLVVTSIWTYVLSVYINCQPTKSDKKEL